ncbi:MAG: rhodanese-like domain-containing protein [Fidelibacterota bacterium]|nr:MAG: rhodanese-like domain-containing protein [Candidatus Neomarinimicrobiota bacterium]
MRSNLAVVLIVKRYFIQLFCIALLAVNCVQRPDAANTSPGAGPGVSAKEELPTITVEALKDSIAADTATFVLDVRTPEEYDGPLGHIEGARLIPVRELAQRLDELADVKDQPISVICRSGGRSARATRMLIDAGFQAFNVTGGMQAWRNLAGKQSKSRENPD